MQNLAKNGFDRLTFAALLAKANFISAQMALNAATFTAPTPTLVVLQDKIDAFAATMPDAEAGSKVAKALRRDARQQLVAALRQLSSYVNMVANTNPTIVDMAGFDLANPRSPVPPITGVTTPVLKNGANSEIDAKTKKVAGAKTYGIFYTTDPALPINEWQVIYCTRASCVIKNTTSGTRYYVKMSAVGKDEQEVFSGIATIVTQYSSIKKSEWMPPQVCGGFFVVVK